MSDELARWQLVRQRAFAVFRRFCRLAELARVRARWTFRFPADGCVRTQIRLQARSSIRFKRDNQRHAHGWRGNTTDTGFRTLSMRIGFFSRYCHAIRGHNSYFLGGRRNLVAGEARAGQSVVIRNLVVRLRRKGRTVRFDDLRFPKRCNYAQKVPVCAWREFHAAPDTSRNWIEVCSDFWGIFRARRPSFSGIARRDATVCVAARSSERGNPLAIARGLQKYAQKRIAGTSMRCHARPVAC